MDRTLYVSFCLRLQYGVAQNTVRLFLYLKFYYFIHHGFFCINVFSNFFPKFSKSFSNVKMLLILKTMCFVLLRIEFAVCPSFFPSLNPHNSPESCDVMDFPHPRRGDGGGV